MAIWDDVLEGKDRQIYEALMKPRELGRRPAVMVVDVNYAFIGFEPEPLEEAIKTFPTSCGELGWEAVPRIRALTDSARELGVPVFYSTMVATPFDRRWGVGGVGWGMDSGDELLRITPTDGMEKRRRGAALVEELGRQSQDIVIEKTGASVFLGTPLVSYLNEMGVDTLIITGTTTSGCVRATAVEASNLNIHAAVVEDCVFDRFLISHKVSLMDMNAKYAKVMSLGETLEYLKTSSEPSISTVRSS
jgi:nicotinamidase-related amidase